MAAEDKEKNTAVETIGALLVGVALIFRAYVFRRLWLWFVVPLHVLDVSIAHAYGLLLLTECFSARRPSKEVLQEPVFVTAVYNTMLSALIWLLAWLAHEVTQVL